MLGFLDRFLRRKRHARFAVRAKWTATVVRPDGTEVVHDLGENLIVNTGLDALKDRMFNPGTVQALFGYVAIGTGVVAETAADVALGTEVARGAATYTAGGVGVCTVERTFPAAGGYEPAAVTEYGLFDAAAAGVMFNRKVSAAVNKTAADALKVACVITATAV